MLSSKSDTEPSTDLHHIPSQLSMPSLMGPDNGNSSSSSTLQHLTVVVPAETEPLDNQSLTPTLGTFTTGHMPVVQKDVGPLTTGRIPVVIPGAGKKLPQKGATSPVQPKQRIALHTSVIFVLTIFMATTLITFLPLGKDGQALGLGGLLQNLGVMNLVNSNTKNTALINSQDATATAIMQQDGYTPPKAVVQQYNKSMGITASGDNFPYGQCTWWADYRYQQLSGYFVPWSGNAYQWAANSQAYAGWMVSSTPHVPSIVVFQPGVQYASPMYGHVAVLESINPDGSLHTSNMNVYGYGFGQVAYLTNYVGAGVSFVWRV